MSIEQKEKDDLELNMVFRVNDDSGLEYEFKIPTFKKYSVLEGFQVKIY